MGQSWDHRPFNPSTEEPEAGSYALSFRLAVLHNRFQASQGYIERPCLEKTKHNQKKKKGKRNVYFS